MMQGGMGILVEKIQASTEIRDSYAPKFKLKKKYDLKNKK